MTPERIAVEVSAAVAATKARMASEDRVYPAPLAVPKCRWCGHRFTKWTEPQWKQLGYCSRCCVDERYNEDARYE